MSRLTLVLSEDAKTLTLDTSEADGKIVMDAADVERLARELAHMRASMSPPLPLENPSPASVILTRPAVRWFAELDELPTQLRLYLLHPGLGWIWIPLAERHVEELTATLQGLLSHRPKLQ